MLGALVISAVGLRVVGANRWAELMRTHTSQLESGRVDVPSPAQGPLPPLARSPARFDARELEGLPSPVQRYFRAVLTDGQPIIAAATIEMVGTINMLATAEQWKPFTSHQRVVTSIAGSRPASCGMPRVSSIGPEKSRNPRFDQGRTLEEFIYSVVFPYRQKKSTWRLR